MKRTMVPILIVGSLLFMTMLGSAIADYEEKPKSNNCDMTQISMRQGNVSSKPQPINLYFYEGAGGSLQADYPSGNSSTEVNCPTSNTANMFGEPVGIWTSAPIVAPLTLKVEISGAIWAKSDANANGVRFRIIIQVNEEDTGIWIETDRHDLGPTPMEFTGSDAGDSELQLNPGDTIGAQVVYFAQPRFFIGPNLPSTMLVGSVEHDTRITVTTSPLGLTINEPVISDDFTIFSASYSDAFSATRLNAKLLVKGVTDVTTLSNPTIGGGNNGSMISWNWNHKMDHARSGEYTITIALSYSEENEFAATEVYILEFPGSGGEDGGLFGMGGWLMPVIIIVVIVVVIAVVVKFVLGRRGEEPTERKSIKSKIPKPSLAKTSKAAKPAAK